MLVLSRKHGESIVVDGTITITVVDIGRGRVQLGVDAPKHVPVHRQEIERRVRDQAAIGRLSPAAASP
jgi:carbon storage regulator